MKKINIIKVLATLMLSVTVISGVRPDTTHAGGSIGPEVCPEVDGGASMAPTPDKAFEDVDTWEAKKVYYGGEIVEHNGVIYKAQWWSLGQEPGTSAAWIEIENPYVDGVEEWVEGATYFAGDEVKYKEQIFVANWWTKSIPGSDDSWTLVR